MTFDPKPFSPLNRFQFCHFKLLGFRPRPKLKPKPKLGLGENAEVCETGLGSNVIFHFFANSQFFLQINIQSENLEVANPFLKNVVKI